MSATLVLVADLLVAVLLVATIASSVALSRRINRLKADEAAMRATIGELVVASETAERAIAGLRTTLGECDRTLADRLRTAERYAADLAEQVEAGEGMMERVARMVDASRRAAAMEQAAPPPPAPPVKEPAPVDRMDATIAAAQALTDRAMRRLEGRAA